MLNICLNEKNGRWENANDLGGIPKNQFNAALECLRKRCKPVKAVDRFDSNFLQSKIHVVHEEDDAIIFLKEKLHKGELADDAIVIQVSRGGRPGLANQEHERWNGTKCRAWLLKVRNHTVLEQNFEAVVALLSMTSSDAEAIYKNDLNKVSSVLREIFTKQTTTTLLAALAILCQGYLAVQAEPGGESANRSLPEAVKTALQDMGWWDIADSPMLKPALQGEDEGELKTLQTKVASKGYWDVLGIRADLEDACAREWKPTAKDKQLEELKNSDEFKSFKKLVTCNFPVKDPTIVANAYLALHEKLGGARE